MIIDLQHQGEAYRCDLAQPLDISIPMGGARCFYAPPVEITPFASGDFIGSVQAGAPVNFYNVKLNPHGNGTHTEGLGHITQQQELIDECLQAYHYMARVISVDLTEMENGDRVITRNAIADLVHEGPIEALIIRTKPNTGAKLTADYSGTNPPYLSAEAMMYIVDLQVQHLLLDLPSVDREVDDGALENHRLFWKVKETTATSGSRKDCTITELIFVPDEIADGLYLLNLQVPSISLDAVPSRPVLYQLKSKR